jgi:competence protein ComEA
MWQQFVKDYFSFTKKERIGAIILVFFILLLIMVPIIFPHLIKTEIVDHSRFEKEITELRKDSNKDAYKNFDNGYYNDYSLKGKKYTPVKTEFFLFDPNTASVNDWVRLGVREKTALTIQKYISKGGKFYKPEDIKKIWGLQAADVERLLPYVSIKNTMKPYPVYERKEYPKNAYTPKAIQKVDINSADTTEYIALPGIGSKLSQRIIAFREKLGGFYSIEQVGETYFLPDSTFQKIKSFLVLNNNSIKKININTASVDEMKSHPYLRYNLANAIFQYRKQHGDFGSVESIKKIMLITEEVFSKIAPYLTIE